MKKVVFILGPTAVGKSAVAVDLAKKMNGEIISADSVQIFKGLDIGSAKVTKEEMSGVVHYGIDICDAKENFSAFEFAQYTKQKINDICSRNKLPIVVGGTGLYVRSLVEGYNFGGTDKDENLRNYLEKLCKEKGVEALFEILKNEAPQEAEKIDQNNPVRIIRAIEINRNQSKKATEKPDIDALVIGLVMSREILYERINMRVDKMLQEGLVDEVKKLKDCGLSENNQSMHAIGYKEVLPYLNGEISYDKMVELVRQHSRNYAKRQLTFLRGMKNCHMIDMQNKEHGFKEIKKLVEDFLR